MKYTSIFCLKSRIRESKREVGGANNYPARTMDNPEGGFIALPYFDNHIKNMIAPGQRGEMESKEKGGGWGMDSPHVPMDGKNFGNDFFPVFSPFMKNIVHSVNKAKKHKQASTKPEKPKAPKALNLKKGPAFKKLHANPHPILAECCNRILGRPTKREAISATSFPLATAGGQKKRESALKILSSRFREAIAVKNGIPNRFRVVLIEEGMGNSNDAYYYTRQALESAVEVFNGAKVYVDHPTAEEEEIRPERSTRDAVGHYENLSVETAPEGGQAWLCADLDILPVKATELQRAQMVRAIQNAAKFPGKDFIGLSINASGPSEETPIENVIATAPEGAKQKLVDAQASDGIETVKVVSKINRAVSCDLVTEAGAGGKILNIIGGNTDGQKAG